jgi:hypothetical protein
VRNGERPVTDLFERLRASRFAAITGAHLTADVPLDEGLLNELLAASIPASAPVRGASIHPDASDKLSVRIVPKAAIMPAITLKLTIEQQPQLPSRPVLVLRMLTLGGLFGLASGAIAGTLPPGVTLQGERILVDLRTIAAQRGVLDLFDYLKSLRVETGPGRVVLHLEAAIE